MTRERIVMRGGGRGARFDGFVAPQPQSAGPKPFGLWYGIDDAWLIWCEREQPNWIGDEFYKLDVDVSRLLIVRPSDVVEFSKKYQFTPPFATEYPPLLKSLWIDWPRIANEYDGVEMPTYSYGSLRFDFIWYNGWDAASGCIWNKRALRGFEKIAAPSVRLTPQACQDLGEK